MNLAALLEAAKELPGEGRPNFLQYSPVVSLLRKKGYSYRKIFDWLREQGEPLEERNYDAFRVASASKLKRLQKLAKGGLDT